MKVPLTDLYHDDFIKAETRKEYNEYKDAEEKEAKYDRN
jgi:hypothetical protein